MKKLVSRRYFYLLKALSAKESVFWGPNHFDVLASKDAENWTQNRGHFIPWTVNDTKSAQRLAQIAAHAITTDRPDILLNWFLSGGKGGDIPPFKSTQLQCSLMQGHKSRH
ncbi:Putative glycerophosphodiester phosphodiesterase domain protein [Candidatus Bealeia paramacronuclearis]|uniref:Glycerophosphodiester phosphodiesterase domain protein n=1 Tax=Candidatus Bealeia paramacronuclearis TaxID=1921001 RepID=A0ABZ2C3K3_9PROT|nr:putative glycerophosphodiester phosphodiesterase domain protein [Candidatus Bealeia paramacronuclearis]